MTLTFYAQPYQIGVEGFYFHSIEEWNAKKNTIQNNQGETVEEFEIQFIDGTPLECDLAKACDIDKGDISIFFNVNDGWDEHSKLCFIIAVNEGNYPFDVFFDGTDDLDISIYFVESLRELAEEFIEQGLFGDIPQNLQNYIDHDAIARDLGFDYTEAEIGGQKLIYRLG